MQHLIRTADFSVEEIIELFEDAKKFNNMQSNKILEGKIIVTFSCFFSSSIINLYVEKDSLFPYIFEALMIVVSDVVV